MNNIVICLDGPWPMYYLQFDDEVFMRHMTCENAIVYWWFTMIGSKEDAANYKVVVSIHMKHNEVSYRLLASWCGLNCPLD